MNLSERSTTNPADPDKVLFIVAPTYDQARRYAHACNPSEWKYVGLSPRDWYPIRGYWDAQFVCAGAELPEGLRALLAFYGAKQVFIERD